MQLIPKSNEIKQRQSMHQIATQLQAGNDHYTLTETAYGHLVIRTSLKNKSVNTAVKTITGLNLATKPLSSVSNDKYLICWISPDEYLLLVPEKTEFEIESRLRDKIKGHFAIVNITGGQTVLELSGERAETILKKSSSYDIHQSNFPVGKVVTTVFAKSQLILRRASDDSFQLVIRRSFSDYLWQWIVDAGSRE
ncbi:MAG: sarcosine oxidase subunit gamma family protein [Cocleimonas sp.]